MKVLRAAELGMCFGVRDALQIASQVPDPTRVTIHGELVHNSQVNERLSDSGFRQSAENNRQILPETPLVLITAHGISSAETLRLQSANKELIDTTCPLVRRVHAAALELQSAGRHVLLIGKAGHVEVQGVVEDLNSYDVIEHPHEVRTYAAQSLGIVCQTTMPSDVVRDVCSLIPIHNPSADIRFIDTVCDPTKRRQQAMLELISSVDAVVVVGGRNSNNTRRLVQLCQAHLTPAVHVEGAEELDPEWFTNVDTVGLTAGTSTLDETIDAVQQELEHIALKTWKEEVV
jgi:4-hydroxy-3-methylbut-2-enyl diphosphate reductase